MSYRASGLRAWIWQRISAVVLALSTLLALSYFLTGGPTNYQNWRNLLAQVPVTVMIGLSFGALLAHIWVGVRDIIIDYISPPGLRYVLLSLLALWLFALGLWVLLLLARISV
ncbi:succinate dehydrogenase / fumarate reductase, membrane anchor subunit [Gammaproteobacteria bacterium]